MMANFHTMLRPTLAIAILHRHGILATRAVFSSMIIKLPVSIFLSAPAASAATTSTFTSILQGQQNIIIRRKTITSRAQQSHEQRENSDSDLGIPRASIRDLKRLIDGISSTSFSSPVVVVPDQLISLINQSAIHEDQSSLSNESYECVVQEMASFVSSTIASFGKSFESEGVYNPELLKIYDALVWGFNSPFLWRISQNDITSLYRANVSRRHCEIAVGTGLFLSDKEIVSSMNEITLMDLNENCLHVCEKRIKTDNGASLPTDVSKFVVDIMSNPPLTKDAIDEEGSRPGPPSQSSPLTPPRGTFHSVGANFLFHCLHGSSLYDKMQAFRNCASLLDRQDGVFFGSTILGKEMLEDEKDAGETAMHLLRTFNSMGVFGNMGDSFQDLENILLEIFEDVKVTRIGYCGVWTARSPRRKKME